MARQSQKTQATREAARPRDTQATLEGTATTQAGNGAGNGLANEEALAAMVRANELLLQGMNEMQREIVEFGQVRLREDFETQEALSQCQDLQEAFRLQADFAQKAFRQYSEETAKLMALSARIGRECWGPFTDATRATFQKTGTD